MICTVQGCSSTAQAKGYCWKHYLQQRRHNNILERTRFDDNDFIIHPDYAEMTIYDKGNKEKISTLIDLDVIEKLKQHKWGSNIVKGSYYVSTKINYKTVYLNHYLYGQEVSKGFNLAYEDKNTLNNRKNNIVLKTREELQEATKLPINNTSGHKGVYQRKKDNRWIAQIKKNGKVHYLGIYDSFQQAVEARKTAEYQYFVSRRD